MLTRIYSFCSNSQHVPRISYTHNRDTILLQPVHTIQSPDITRDKEKASYPSRTLKAVRKVLVRTPTTHAQSLGYAAS